MPASRAPKIAFANLIYRFGDELVLLDLADEVVIPAFTNTELRRATRGGTYFFLNVQISEVPDVEEGLPPLLVVHGKLVNDTLMTRDQFYSNETGLVVMPQSMPSAPTSFFALILNSHKLLYVPELEDAPSL